MTFKNSNSSGRANGVLCLVFKSNTVLKFTSREKSLTGHFQSPTFFNLHWSTIHTLHSNLATLPSEYKISNLFLTVRICLFSPLSLLHEVHFPTLAHSYIFPFLSLLQTSSIHPGYPILFCCCVQVDTCYRPLAFSSFSTFNTRYVYSYLLTISVHFPYLSHSCQYEAKKRIHWDPCLYETTATYDY